jgi:hypothetical protein
MGICGAFSRGCSVTAGRGILWSAISTGILGFATTILFLFCTPDLDTVFALDAPQPFVQIYALALGKKASIFMTILAVLGLIMVGFYHAYTRDCAHVRLEHVHRRCRRFAPNLRRRARRCTANVVVD